MLNIFADALMIAARIGRLPEGKAQVNPPEIQHIEALRTVETLRQPLR